MMLCRAARALAFRRRREMKMIEAISMLAWLAGVSGAPVPAVDPLTQPITTSRSAEWLTPAEPEEIFGETYLVGFGGMSVALIPARQWSRASAAPRGCAWASTPTTIRSSAMAAAGRRWPRCAR